MTCSPRQSPGCFEKSSMSPVLRCVALIAMLVVSGCRYGEELFDQADATADPRAVFPSLTATTESSSEPGRDSSPCAGDAANTRFRLGDVFSAELPTSEGWAWAESGQATILLHSRGGETLPSAFLYAEKIDLKRLGAGMQAFHQSIDQRVSRAEFRPGYSSERGTFSGWRWLGECAAREGESSDVAAKGQPVEEGELKPFLRLSRSQGSWRRLPGSESEPALMVLATVTLPDRRNFGFHLAIVCRQVPQCEEAAEFAQLLGSLRVSQSANAMGSAKGVSRRSRMLKEFADEVGVSLPAVAADPFEDS